MGMKTKGSAWNFRVSPETYEKVKDSARKNGRSMNQEVVSRLEKSFWEEGLL